MTDHVSKYRDKGYVRGEWAFRNGEPVPFGPEQALVHYEQRRGLPAPHFV